MLSFIIIALTGVILGISMAAPPGPVMTIIMNRSLNGVKQGFLVGMGAMTADIILLLVVLELNSVVNFSIVEPYVFLAGGLFFVYLAYKIFNKRNEEIEDTHDEIRSGNYLRGLTVGILNPMQIGWWLTAGLGILRTEGITPYYFFYAGIIGYVLLFSFFINRAYIKFGSTLKKGISIFSVIVLLGFGIYFLYAFTVTIL